MPQTQLFSQLFIMEMKLDIDKAKKLDFFSIIKLSSF
jgi:hypothetical protein